MKIKSSRAILNELKRIDAQIADCLTDLGCTDPLIVGSISQVLRSCGKPNCRCAKSPSHPVLTLMTTRPDGTRRCQVVRRADEHDVTAKVHRYRDFRKRLIQLKSLQSQRLDLLKSLMHARGQPYP